MRIPFIPPQFPPKVGPLVEFMQNNQTYLMFEEIAGALYDLEENLKFWEGPISKIASRYSDSIVRYYYRPNYINSNLISKWLRNDFFQRQEKAIIRGLAAYEEGNFKKSIGFLLPALKAIIEKWISTILPKDKKIKSAFKKVFKVFSQKETILADKSGFLFLLAESIYCIVNGKDLKERMNEKLRQEIGCMNETLKNCIYEEERGVYRAEIKQLESDLKEFEIEFDKNKEILEIVEQQGDLESKAVALYNIGNIFRKQEVFSEALDKYKKAFEIAEQPEHQIAILQDIGTIYLIQKKYPKALERFKEVRLIIEQHEDLNPEVVDSLEIATTYNIGICYYMQENYTEALNQFEDLLRFAGKLEDQIIKSILEKIMSCYFLQKKYHEVLIRFEDLLQTAETQENLVLRDLALESILTIYLIQKKYSQALRRFEDLLEHSEQQGDLRLKAAAMYNIGRFYYIRNKSGEALSWFTKALEIATKLGASKLRTKILDKIEAIRPQQN